jgi:hypothetical protein
MYLNPALTFPFVDADRKGGNKDNNWRLGARTVIVLAYLLAFAAWMVWRWGVRG